MKFGPVPVARSVGAMVAHGVHENGVVLRKGEVVRAEDVAALVAASVRTIVVAELEAGDVPENEAARRLAEAVTTDGLRVERAFTGRANLFARSNGVLLVDVETVDRLNDIDESLTLATLPPYRAVEAGEMVATVKVIPFAVPARVLDAAIAAVPDAPLGLRPFRPLRVGVVSTLLPGLKASVIAKTLRILEDRLAPAGATVVADVRVPHDIEALAVALRGLGPACDLLVIYGASAIADRRDVIPAGLEHAGGSVRHFGMPVDPGNLLLLGVLGGKPVIGAPGCARSPKENGFDWVLQRLLAGIDVTPADLRRLGTGGLLMEIVSRPQPRQGDVAESASVPAEPVG